MKTSDARELTVEGHGIIRYWIQGSGKDTIVFSHGATVDHGLFEYQIDAFANDYTVIVWDAPAHGDSRPFEGFTLRLAADSLVGILDKESKAKAHLVGQSMGSYVSAIAARFHNERVSSLTVVDGSPVFPSYFNGMDRWLLRITPGILRMYPYKTMLRQIANGIAKTDYGKAYAMRALSRHSKEEIASIMGAVYQGVLEYPDDNRLEVPTLIVFGSEDKTGKVQSYSRKWAERDAIPLRVIDGASHNANMDQPDEFNAVLSEFLLSVAGD